MISDQQDINPENFDNTALPEYVEVIFIARKEIRKKLYRGVQGKVTKVMANFNVTTSQTQQQKFAQLLFNHTLGLALTRQQLDSGQLFLFNDRNKISRLFRLAFAQYSLIEEGLANYSGTKLKLIERVNTLITASKRTMRYFGDDSRCQSIYLVSSDKAPHALKHKVKQIDFLQEHTAVQHCKAFFKMPTGSSYSHILATQPLANTGIDLSIYRKIILECQSHNIPIAIKPHPREDISRYAEAFPNIELIDSKLPLELIAVDTLEQCNVLSIFSTAGIGFETHCKRINLIKDNEIEQVDDFLSDWKLDLNTVDNRVTKLFAEME